MNNFTVIAQQNTLCSETPFEVVERKGIGHPDTLCDTIAEKISQAYSQYTLNEHGVVLRHMVDKIALAGGASHVQFGKGFMERPIHLYLNCRFTKDFEGREVPYLDIASNAAKKHFKAVMPLLDVEQWLTIIDNTHMAPGPGVVHSKDGNTKNERGHFFTVPNIKFARYHDNDLRSNDTSTAVAYAPLSEIELLTIAIENQLNEFKGFKKEHPYVGTDIKVMSVRNGRNVKITACIPFVAAYTNSLVFYRKSLQEVSEIILGHAKTMYPYYNYSVELNTRDNAARQDFYLTAIGSAIESGDEGVVGRGNRHNGIIPFTRNMSMEACCGKNPIYHVGKLYTAAAQRIADNVFNAINTECKVFITSQMGRNLDDPWMASIEINRPKLLGRHEDTVKDIYIDTMKNLSVLSQEIIEGKCILY